MIKGADQYLNEKPFGKFLMPPPTPPRLDAIPAGYRLSGAVVSQRLSPLTNPFAAMSAPLFLVIDWNASSHCNYTVGPADHLFYNFHHLPKKKKNYSSLSFQFSTSWVSCAQKTTMKSLCAKLSHPFAL